MIILANEDFAMGLRLSGVKNSHIITNRERGLEALAHTPKNELIIATDGVCKLLPELLDYENLVIFPDTLHDFSKIDDLSQITKVAIGAEVDI